jgi:hypothetical protein
MELMTFMKIDVDMKLFAGTFFNINKIYALYEPWFF